MVTLGTLWLPIVLSAVLVFVASSIVWMALPHHKGDWKPLPDEAGAMQVLGRMALPPGQYRFPWAADQKAMQTPAFLEKLKKGPVGHLVVLPPGPFSMGRTLAVWFVYLLVVSVFVAYLTGRTVAPGTDYLRVFRVAGTVAVMAYAVGHATSSIWWGRPWSVTLKDMADGVLYSLLTAGAFGWLWPR
jgi:hypothetical protein